MEIILSTRNRSKADQIKALVSGPGVTVLSLADAGVVGEVVEDGATLEENAFKKAEFASAKTGKWAIADDTGLFIDALDGKPGIHAARWAGEGKTTEEIRDFTLDQLKGVPEGRRTATFRVAAVVVSPKGERHVFEGVMNGKILFAPRTQSQPDMPYSSIFVPDGHDKVWAEMSVDEENAISHRGQAFRKVRDFFQSLVR